MNDLEVAFAVNQAAPTFTCLSVLSEHRYVINVKVTTFDQMRMTMAASKHGSRCYPGFSLIISCLVLLMCQRSYLSPRICADLRWDAAEALTLGFIEDMLSTRSYILLNERHGEGRSRLYEFHTTLEPPARFSCT